MTDKRTGLKAAPRACAVCGEEFRPCIRRPEARYCSHSCIWAATKAPEFNANVARETATKRGNTQRGRGEGKTYRKLNGRHEHRVKAEQKLGRPLRSGEIVHHADETKLNNAPGNLDVLPNQGEHARLHFAGRKQSGEHVRKRIEATTRTKRERRLKRHD